LTKLAPALDAAITYAAHGLKSFPIKARSKAPATAHGFKDATLEGGVLHRKFTAAGADANVGIATGGGIIVVDLDGPQAEEWARTYDWPRTWVATSGRPDGGRHLYFKVDRPVATRPQQGGIGPKVDVKGEGGYVLAPPSVHPDGPTYAWAKGGPASSIPIAAAPTWLTAMLDEPRRPTEAKGPLNNPEVITDNQDEYGARQAASLAARGMPLPEARAALEAMIATRFAGGWAGLDSARPWRKEDVERWLDGAYAKFYDPGAPALAAADAKLQALAAGRLNRKAPAQVTAPPAAAAPVELDEDSRTGWERADLGPAVRGEVLALPPRMLDRSDGAYLLYPGKLHWVSGEPEGLKSWLAQIAVADALADGLTAAYVDFEGDDLTIVGRLRALGVKDDAILTRLSYHRPEVPMTPAMVARLLRDIDEINPAISVIDGVNAAMGASALDSNHATDFHRWWTQFGHRLQRATSGPTLAIDHVVKNPENRGQYAAGTGQKLAAVDVHIGTIVVEPFGIGMTGRAKLVLHKDRPGALRPKAFGRQLGVLTLASDPRTHEIRFSIEPAAGEGADPADIRPTNLMEKASRKLEGLVLGKKKSDLKREIPGKTEFVIRAIDALIAEGYAASVPSGTTHVLTLIKRYRESEDDKRVAAPLRQAGHTPAADVDVATVPNRSLISGTVRAADDITVPPLQGTGIRSGSGNGSPVPTVPDHSLGTGTVRTDLCAVCGDDNWFSRKGKWICGSCGEVA
jgi:hypothetical protein